MANAQKGEVTFKALGEDWTIKLGTNAMCEIEDATGESINTIGQTMNSNKFTMRLMRTVFFCGMADFHDMLTERQVGNILDEIGFAEASNIMMRAFVLATPEAKKEANPRKAARS